MPPSSGQRQAVQLYDIFGDVTAEKLRWGSLSVILHWWSEDYQQNDHNRYYIYRYVSSEQKKEYMF